MSAEKKASPKEIKYLAVLDNGSGTSFVIKDGEMTRVGLGGMMFIQSVEFERVSTKDTLYTRIIPRFGSPDLVVMIFSDGSRETLELVSEENEAKKCLTSIEAYDAPGKVTCNVVDCKVLCTNDDGKLTRDVEFFFNFKKTGTDICSSCYARDPSIIESSRCERLVPTEKKYDVDLLIKTLLDGN